MRAYRKWTYKGTDVSRVSRDAVGMRWEARLTGHNGFIPERYPLVIRSDTRRGMRRLINYYLTEME